MKRRARETGGWHFDGEMPRRAVNLASAVDNSTALAICMALADIESGWESLAGRALASRSAPKSYENGVLRVAVASAGAMQDMNFRKRHIMAAINKVFPDFVRDVDVFVGSSDTRVERRRYTGFGRAPKREVKIDDARAAELADDIERSAGVGGELARTLARFRVLCESRARRRG